MLRKNFVHDIYYCDGKVWNSIGIMVVGQISQTYLHVSELACLVEICSWRYLMFVKYLGHWEHWTCVPHVLLCLFLSDFCVNLT